MALSVTKKLQARLEVSAVILALIGRAKAARTFAAHAGFAGSIIYGGHSRRPDQKSF
jgi:hypothetical protein